MNIPGTYPQINFTFTKIQFVPECNLAHSGVGFADPTSFCLLALLAFLLCKNYGRQSRPYEFLLARTARIFYFVKKRINSRLTKV